MGTSDLVRGSEIPVVLSTSSTYPERAADCFEVAAELGYDGVEVMVTTDQTTQDVRSIRELAERYGVPVPAIHAPCLLVTQWVWGRDPWAKLRRAADTAEQLGAGVVVVHPPFRWQRDYARGFETGLADLQAQTEVKFAVENMFPVRMSGAEMVPYAPGHDPLPRDYRHVTLDVSHTSASGSDPLEMARRLAGRLAHVHLGDGSGIRGRDEHLVPGRGVQPCAELLELLVATGYAGSVVLEINTHKGGRAERRSDIAEALSFTRKHLSAASDGAPAAR